MSLTEADLGREGIVSWPEALGRWVANLIACMTASGAKRTSGRLPMSAKCQLGNTRREHMFSALPPTTDIRRHVRVVPNGDIDVRPTGRSWRKAAVHTQTA